MTIEGKTAQNIILSDATTKIKDQLYSIDYHNENEHTCKNINDMTIKAGARN